MLDLATTAASASDLPREQELTQLLASLCKASADPLRLQILRVLRKDSFAVSELCAIFDTRQPALSHHLKVLRTAARGTRRTRPVDLLPADS